ncbi:MAG TPA: transglutaminaseTgpA domain-containing protein [Acidimicrobiales bacterium]|nr:transglutaminaseTgpA domain-containing protein [Acidimicrobiales bacterium]
MEPRGGDVTVRRLLGAVILPLAAAMVFLSSTPWMRAFAPSTLVPLVVAAAVVSVAVPAVVVRAFDRPAPWSILASAVLFVLLALFGVLRQPLGFEDLARGFIHGPARLLSETLPVDHPRYLLVVPVALCWLVGAVTGELLERGRSVGWPSLVPLVGFGVAFAATSGGAGNDVGWAVALFAVDGVVLFSRQWLQRSPAAGAADGDRARSPVRPLVYGTGTLVIAGVVCAFAVPAIPALKGAPTTPTRTPPVTTVEPITPTAEIAELRNAGDLRAPSTLYTVTVNRTSPGYVSLTDLDAYDGDVWSFNGAFRPTGGSVPVALGTPATPTRDLVSQRYTAIKPPAVPWMPFIDRPVKVNNVDVQFEPSSGMVLPTTPLAAGSRFTMTSDATDHTLLSLDAQGLATPLAASPDALDAVVPTAETSALSKYVTQLAATADQPAAPTLGFLKAVEQVFRTDYRQVPPPTRAPATSASTAAAQQPTVGGTSFQDVAQAVMGQRQATPEQFATMYALLARSLGVPARLVTGFKTGDLAPNVPTKLTDAEAWTWVEVPVSGVGWVVVDPTPTAAGTPPTENLSSSTTSTTAPPPANAKTNAGTNGHALAPRVNVRGHHSDTALLIAVAVVAGVIIVAGLALGWIIMGKRRRLKRRRDGETPIDRVVGAWHETLDTLTEADMSDLAALTSDEVGESVRRHLGQPVAAHANRVGAAANVALFSSGASIDTAAADEVWHEHDALRRSIHDTLGLRPRIRMTLRTAPKHRRY